MGLKTPSGDTAAAGRRLPLSGIRERIRRFLEWIEAGQKRRPPCKT